MIDLSVIIVSYNNKQVITDCLNSIVKYNDIGNRLQVIVVEQSPTTDIFDYISNNYTWVNVIRHENNGFGAGNNAGIKIAKAPFLLFLNPDTILIEPIFSFAINKFQNAPKLGMFGVQLLDRNMNKNSSFMMRNPYGLWNKAIYKICSAIGFFYSKRMYIQGADMFIRRDVFEEIGQFDSNIFMYCEESDLSIRIIRAGYMIKYDPTKAIIHLEGKSTKDDYDLVLEKQILSFRYLCDKHNMSFKKIITNEYRFQRLKLLICILFRRNQIDAQNRIVKMIGKLV